MPRVAEPLLPRLIVAQIGLHAAMAGVRLGAPLQVLRDGHGPLAAGAVLAMFAAAPVLLAMPAGRMADRHGYHRPMRWAVAFTLAGGVLALLACLAAGWARLLLLGAAGAAVGAGTNIGLITVQRSAGRLAHDAVQRMKVFSWLGMAPAIANAIGPVLAGAAIDLGGFVAAYALMLLLPLVTVVVARRVPGGGWAGGVPGPRERTAVLLQLPGLKRLLVVNWLFSSFWDVHLFAVPLLGHERGLSAFVIGLVLGSFTVAVTGVRVLIPFLAHRLREAQVLRGAMWLAAAVFAAYPLAHSPWAMAALSLLLGVALGSVQPMLMAMLHHIVPPAHHGQAIALRSMAMNGSGSLMPLAFGGAGAALGVAGLFWVAAAVAAGGQRLVRRLPQPPR